MLNYNGFPAALGADFAAAAAPAQSFARPEYFAGGSYQAQQQGDASYHHPQQLQPHQQQQQQSVAPYHQFQPQQQSLSPYLQSQQQLQTQLYDALAAQTAQLCQAQQQAYVDPSYCQQADQYHQQLPPPQTQPLQQSYEAPQQPDAFSHQSSWQYDQSSWPSAPYAFAGKGKDKGKGKGGKGWRKGKNPADQQSAAAYVPQQQAYGGNAYQHHAAQPQIPPPPPPPAQSLEGFLAMQPHEQNSVKVRELNSTTLLDLARHKDGSPWMQNLIDGGTLTTEDVSYLFGVLMRLELCTDRYANYLVQKLVPLLDDNHLSALYGVVKGNCYTLATNVGGCRVLQSFFEKMGRDDRACVCAELENRVWDLTNDAFGNNVIQHLINMSPEHSTFVLKAMLGLNKCTNVFDMSTHQHGCRIVQKLLEKAPPQPLKERLVEAIASHAKALCVHPSGNYVIQKALDVSKDEMVQALLPLFYDDVRQVACQKTSTNIFARLASSASEVDVAGMIDYVLRFDTPGAPLVVELMADHSGKTVMMALIPRMSSVQAEAAVDIVTPWKARLLESPSGYPCVAELHTVSPKPLLLPEDAPPPKGAKGKKGKGLKGDFVPFGKGTKAGDGKNGGKAAGKKGKGKKGKHARSFDPENFESERYTPVPAVVLPEVD
ncbi:Pumilio domain-containing protein C6G9.14 [Diplonema papillatum]|nr:Pumilio domain-containing protein C6G9.14 [Diplonema papillatum]